MDRAKLPGTDPGPGPAEENGEPFGGTARAGASAAGQRRASSLTAQASCTGETAELLLSGELDWTTTPALCELLGLALGRQPRTLTLHMAGIRCIDGAAAQVIADAARLLPAPARMVVCCPSLPVRTVLHHTGLGTTLGVKSPERVAGCQLLRSQNGDRPRPGGRAR